MSVGSMGGRKFRCDLLQNFPFLDRDGKTIRKHARRDVISLLSSRLLKTSYDELKSFSTLLVMITGQRCVNFVGLLSIELEKMVFVSIMNGFQR